MNTISQGDSLKHVKTGEDILLTIKRILTERPSLNKKILQLIGSTNKTVKQILNDEDTRYGCTLIKCYQHLSTNKALN